MLDWLCKAAREEFWEEVWGGGGLLGLDGSLAAALHQPVRRSVHPSALLALPDENSFP